MLSIVLPGLTIHLGQTYWITSAVYRYEFATSSLFNNFVIGSVQGIYFFAGKEISTLEQKLFVEQQSLDHIIHLLLLYQNNRQPIADILPWSRVCPLLRLIVKYVIWCRFIRLHPAPEALLYMQAYFITAKQLLCPSPDCAYRGTFTKEFFIVRLKSGQYMAALEPDILELKFPEHAAYLNRIFVHQKLDGLEYLQLAYQHISAIPFDLLIFQNLWGIDTWQRTKEWYEHLLLTKKYGYDIPILIDNFAPIFDCSYHPLYFWRAYAAYKPEIGLPKQYAMCCNMFRGALTMIVGKAMKNPEIMARLLNDLGTLIPGVYPIHPFKIANTSSVRLVIAYVLWCLAYNRTPQPDTVTYFQANKLISFNALILGRQDWLTKIDTYLGGLKSDIILRQHTKLLRAAEFVDRSISKHKRRRLP